MSKGISLIEFIQTNQNDFLEKWTEKIIERDDQRASNILSDDMYRKVASEYFSILNRYFYNSSENNIEKISDLAHRIVQLGWSMKFLIENLKELSLLIFQKITSSASDEKKMEIIWEFDKWISPINNELLNQYASSLEKKVSLQKIALQELSAPLIPVFDNITVMPLVGTIDTERAKKIMENLLQGVVKHRAEVVLIDITGVPVVDTMVAHHIIQASEAVRLVGAKCLLVGIRPEIAQTIVNLGIDLSYIITKNTLQKGIEAALEMTNRKIIQSEV